MLYKVQGPESEGAVLVRIYGEDTDVLIDRDRDNALFHELARCAEEAKSACCIPALCRCRRCFSYIEVYVLGVWFVSR